MTGAGMKPVRTGGGSGQAWIYFILQIFFIVVKYNKIYHLNHFQSIQFSSMCNHHHRASQTETPHSLSLNSNIWPTKNTQIDELKCILNTEDL